MLLVEKFKLRGEGLVPRFWARTETIAVMLWLQHGATGFRTAQTKIGCVFVTQFFSAIEAEL